MRVSVLLRGTVARSWVALLLIVLIAAGMPLAGCSRPPATAEVRVYVTDPDGAPLEGVVISIRDQSATTDRAGSATLSRLQPGTVTVAVSAGQDRELTSTEAITAGPNNLNYTLEPPYRALGISDLMRLRLRLTQVENGLAQTFAAAAVDLEYGSSHWDFGDGELIILEGGAAHLKHEGHWRAIDDYITAAVADIFMTMATEYLGTLAMVAEQLSGANAATLLIATGETVNGELCRVYEVGTTSAEGSLTYTVHVVASGVYAGRITRYAYAYDGGGDGGGPVVVTDIWDFDGSFRVLPPQ